MKRLCLIPALVSTFAFSQETQKFGGGFEAPAVEGRGNIYNPVFGEIVYDATAKDFYGYAETTGWKSLSSVEAENVSGASSVTSPEIGEIVYDSVTKDFFGYVETSSAPAWKNISTTRVEAENVNNTSSVTSPAAGEIVYDTVTDDFYGYASTSPTPQWKKLSSPGVAVRCTSDATQSLTDGSETIINFNLCDSNNNGFDDLGKVTTGLSWVFTAPEAGIYVISARIGIDAPTGSGANNEWNANERAILSVYKSGVEYAYLDRHTSYGTHQGFVNLQGTTNVDLAVNETIQLRLEQNSGAARSVASSAGSSESIKHNYISINRIPD